MRSKIACTTKEFDGILIFLHAPDVKSVLWGCAFCGSGYCINRVCRHSNEKIITKYVKNQGKGKEYEVLHENDQLKLF